MVNTLSNKMGNKFSEPEIHLNSLINSVEYVGVIYSGGRYSVQLVFASVELNEMG